jgi:uncharacterized coiled-coil protein SlyX
MDAIETLRQEVREGRISTDRLVDVIASQQRQLQAMQQQLQAAKERLAELEKNVDGSPPTAKLDEPFSMRSEEQRQEARGQKHQPKRKGRRGRFQTKDKIAQAERTEPVYPEGVPPKECHLSHVRPVWRLENGRAVLIAYQRLPNTLNVNFIGHVGTVLLQNVPEIAASTGSACHEGTVRLSPVLQAMGVPPELGQGAVRLSVGRFTTEDEIDRAAGALALRAGR